MEQAIAEGEVTEKTVTKNRKDKRKEWKKEKRRQERRERAEKEREEEVKKMEDPEEQRRAEEMEEEEKERMERERKEFEERERKWMEEIAIKRKLQEQEEEERNKKLLEEEKEKEKEKEKDNKCSEDDDDWEYMEEGPAEIIWQGNEIIVRKKKVKVPKKNSTAQLTWKEDAERPTSNPLPPQSEAFLAVPPQEMLENVAQQVPNFGTEQDKAHCPFHLKTGACRFGQRCSRVHFYPDNACTLLIKNMYNGPGLAWEQDEGLEYTDDEVDRCYEEFYEDVHTEFLKYGEIVNFKACKNGSFHLRGNVYIHYKSLDSAVLAYHSINGRYFAGKQITCEFVNLTRWKVAICGEYMRSRFKTCSHGTACNFIHCFRNPGGDYEWADWDKPPPRYWLEKMTALFGYSDESVYEKEGGQDELGRLRASGKRIATDTDRHHAKSRSRDSFRSSSKSRGKEGSIHWPRDKWHDRKRIKNFGEKEDIEDNNHRKGRSHDNCDGYRSDEDRERDMKAYRHDDRPRRRSKNHTEMPECSTNYGAHKNRIKDVEVDSNKKFSDGPHNHTKNLRQWVKAGNPDDSREDKKEAHGVDKEMRHSDLEISSGHRYKIGSPNDLRDIKDGTSDIGSSAELQRWDREVDRQHHRRQSSRHWKDVSESPDHQDDDRYRAHGYDSSDDQFERDKERRGHRRKRSSDSRHKFLDDERLSAKRSKGNHGSSNPETGKSHLKGNRRGSRESGEAHSASLERNKLHDYNNVDRYHKKRESDYTNSGYNSVEEVDEQDRWKP